MKKLLAITLGCLTLSVSVLASAASINQESLMNLDKDTVDKIKSNDFFSDEGGVRLKAIKDRGFQMGAQYGYIERMNDIQEVLKDRSNEIDKIYNFTYLMSMSNDNSAEMYLIPPIIEKHSDIKSVDQSSNTLTIIENQYVITQPARLVTQPLDWRQYLTFSFEVEEMEVAESLIPEEENEKIVWKASVSEGWHEGSQLAEREMLSRMEKLVQDFRGIILFNRLSDEGRFIRPKLIETRTPVTGNDKKLVENKTTYTIVTQSRTHLDERDWQAVVLDNRESMIFPSRYENIKIEVQ